VKPENHAIRDLEKMLKAEKRPKAREKIERVILSLKAVLLNEADPAAKKIAKAWLAEDLDTLNKLLESKD
jgi:predicted lipid-binding transport protein (Tim44 family)